MPLKIFGKITEQFEQSFGLDDDDDNSLEFAHRENASEATRDLFELLWKERYNTGQLSWQSSLLQELLRENADVLVTDEHETTLLHLATAAGNVDIMQALLQYDGVDINAQDEYGRTPLHEAVAFGQSNAMVALLDAGANLYAFTANHQSLLHTAARYDQSLIIVQLMQEVEKRSQQHPAPWTRERDDYAVGRDGARITH
jgi:ankyrin repeat protein